jgi:4-amino-4-deoxy-L-arabinose transferase-like glycosyltransferase
MIPASKRKPRGERIDAPAAEADRPAAFQFAAIDALLLALVLGFAMLLIERTGFANGQELWPAPDAIEYAAMAVNLDRGMGPVLHFADQTYPARYTIGYPLMLATAYPFLGKRPERLCLVTALTALIAIAGIYLLTLWGFDRRSAIVAAILLATSPYFVGLSTCVLSDVPALAVCLLAVLAFLYAEERDSRIASALCGILVGWAITIRLTNVLIVPAIAAAIVLVRPRKLSLPRILAFAIGMLPFPAFQLWTNWHYLGSPTANGYAFWRPDIYHSSLNAFSLRYLFYPALPNGTQGNLLAYGLAVLGLDGLHGRLKVGMEIRPLLHSHYSLYPFPVAIFGAMGTVAAWRDRREAITLRTMYLGGGFLASLLFVYLFYFFHDPRFLFPGFFILLALAAYGIVDANQNFTPGARTLGIVVLDTVMVVAIVMETISRLAMPSPDSKIVAEVQEMRPGIAHSVLVSDLSMQWDDLFLGGEGIEFVGLDSLLAEEAITEYHLHFLYENRAVGRPVPPILLPEGKLDPVEARKLSAMAAAGRPVYLLVAMPMRQDWASTLMAEFGELDRAFTLEPVTRYPELGLYRLKPR